MEMYKEYVYKLTELSLNEPYIIIKDDVAPKLKEYIRLLTNIKFEDGKYHTYYGEIKTILPSFTNYWTETMDEALRKVDEIKNFVTMDELLKMLDRTILIYEEKQNDFIKEFLLAKDSLDTELSDKMQTNFTNCMENLYNLKDKIKLLDKQVKVEAFAKDHFEMSLKRKNDVFCFTHCYISMKLRLFMSRIRVSLQEIVDRFRNNLRSMQETSEVNISRLLIRLYEKNKEHLMLSREDIRSSVEIAEVQRSLDILKDKIEDTKHVPMNRLQDECKYWLVKICEFQKIEDTIKKIESEERSLMEQEKDYLELRNEQIPAPKQKCWDNMQDTLTQRKEELSELKLNASKALFTFFGVTGLDRLYYYDHVGKYFVDDLGHQCYVFDYGLKVYHVTCDGTLVDKPDNDKYFYDNNGRFVMDENNKKLYQIAPCSSTYALQDGVFVKRSHDCHSEGVNRQCCMEIKDCEDDIVLPDVQNIDIKGKLTADDANYLWDTFGHILPEVLRDVAEEQPKNPIHILAHKLLLYKYNGKNDMVKKKQEAIKYREKVQQDRLDKIEAIHKAWKAKQVKRRKPEESDDTEDQFAYNLYKTQETFARNVENFYN